MAYNNSSTPGFTFTINNTSLTILAGELYGSTQGNGIASNASGNTLINNGNILGGLGDGVIFGSLGNNAVTNNANASIIGQEDGIYTQGDHDKITNFGTVMGLDGYGVVLGDSTNHVVVTNRGEIYGRSAGVGSGSIHDGNTIDNFGVVRSDNDGLICASPLSALMIVTNEAGGVISATPPFVPNWTARSGWLMPALCRAGFS